MKCVLITGSNSGMGLETVKLLAERGYRVFAGIRSEQGKEVIEQLGANNEHYPFKPVPVYLDVTCTESVDAAVEQVMSYTDKLDVLVNNAGYGLVSAVEDTDDDMGYRQFDVNVFGVLRCCRAVIPVMRKQRSGHIINISSFLGKVGLPFLTHYNASKYAVEGITDSLRFELAEFGIRVNTVAPGLFRTEFVNKGLDLNGDTLDDNSPYSKFANAFVPVVAERINNGADPVEVGYKVLDCIEQGQSQRRLAAGEDATLFASKANAMNETEFETWYCQTMGLPHPV